MKYKFIDIGTSHFATSIDEFGTEVDGILVEPIKKYLDIIPNSERIKKANFAISDENRTGFMYVNPIEGPIKYVSETEMDGLNKNEIGSHGLNFIDISLTNATGFEKLSCEVITFNKLCETYDVEEIENLKIDTEGHDHVILKQVYQRIKNKKLIVSNQIRFEYNRFSNKQELNQLIPLFEEELNFTSAFSKNTWDEFDVILLKNK